MNHFSNTTKETTSTNNPNMGQLNSKLGSGAEQDRYGSHFGVGHDGIEKMKHVAEFKGTGAEQERYESHFGLDQDKVKAATHDLLHRNGSGAEQDRYEGHFGLGADGVERAKQLASMKGVGAEQVCALRFLT
ncbi:uncharacterized protein BDR25DRAFT_242083 [Lindgomyces ingoldianus]|uniref:Uncharacterized protein n=1 Tax=Lindgomyces ingoldianus TaxID=673940 RepID=A0ACB6QCI4_9PLEO|nr:uncharacterized protein BDR25DRAFT_242083 [Lindgomyces ingoldianus]KAF2464565.1 hypothetical protein BDR25DRAFT_242083 [Lindgomyces ingoldianus]